MGSLTKSDLVEFEKSLLRRITILLTAQTIVQIAVVIAVRKGIL